MSHYIGDNSEFDIGMDIVEIMIKYKNGDKNYENKLKNYYEEKLLRYINVIETLEYDQSSITFSYLNDQSKKISIRFSKDYNKEKYKKITDIIKTYESIENYVETEVNKSLQIIKEKYHNFLRKDSLSLKLIYEIVISVSDIFCLNNKIQIVNNYLYNYDKDNNDKINLILIDDSGQFTYNTFLYAYINGVNLIGVPLLESFADGNLMCTLEFIEHDLEHLSAMEVYEISSDKIKFIYYNIMDSNYDKKQKELLLTGLFYICHELYYNLDKFAFNGKKRNFKQMLYGKNPRYTNFYDFDYEYGDKEAEYQFDNMFLYEKKLIFDEINHKYYGFDTYDDFLYYVFMTFSEMLRP